MLCIHAQKTQCPRALIHSLNAQEQKKGKGQGKFLPKEKNIRLNQT
tara:strand:+ start:538 stop:675 length:138 start_codon:yes stop_codon:yes gene_type:complete